MNALANRSEHGLFGRIGNALFRRIGLIQVYRFSCCRLGHDFQIGIPGEQLQTNMRLAVSREWRDDNHFRLGALDREQEFDRLHHFTDHDHIRLMLNQVSNDFR